MKNINQILDELIDQFTPEIAKAFREAISEVSDRAILKELVRYIRLGDPEGAFRSLGYGDAAMRPFTEALEKAFETGGVTTGKTFPNVLNTPSGAVVYRFDVRNSRAEKWLRENGAQLVSRIGEQTRVNLRNVMTQGLEAGRNPRNIALDIVGRLDRRTGKRTGGIIGLNEPQARAVSAMRVDLENLDARYFTRERRDKRFDATVQKLFEKGKVDKETINKLTGRYSDNLLKLRGDTIARDGAIESLQRSRWEALKQADDIGAINEVKRVWDDTGDRRTRATHREMDGQTVGLDEPFTFPNGDKAMFPQDRSLNAGPEETVNCRCTVKIKVDWLKAAQNG